MFVSPRPATLTARARAALSGRSHGEGAYRVIDSLSEGAPCAPPRVAVGYSSPQALSAALARHPGVVLRRLPSLGVAEVQPFAPGLRPRCRASASSKAESAPSGSGPSPVSRPVLRSTVRVAVPGDACERRPGFGPARCLCADHRDRRQRRRSCRARHRREEASGVQRPHGRRAVRGGGHGTLWLLRRARCEPEGVAGSGDASCSCQASGRTARSDVDEASDRLRGRPRARVINLSIGGPDTSGPSGAVAARATARSRARPATSSRGIREYPRAAPARRLPPPRSRSSLFSSSPPSLPPPLVSRRCDRSARRARAGVRRCARSPCRSGTRRRSSKSLRRRGSRAASPSRHECRGFPSAARAASPAR